MRSLASRLGLGVALTLALFGCKSRSTSGQPATGVSAAVGNTSSVAAPEPSAPAVPPAQAAAALPTSSAQLPEGPALAIQAGQGVGPIRIGATVKTIERLMEAPCEVKTPEVCRYIVRAVEFQLDKAGVTQRIVVHRKDRPALDAHGKPQAYGFFNGVIPPGAALGMIPKAVQQILGPPQSSERVTTANPFHTLARDTYPGGMVLEYDEYTNGNVMLGGVIISKPK